MTQYTHWQAQVLKAYYHERGFGTRPSRNHSHVTNHDIDINHLCTQPSQSQQSLTNLKQCALLNHKPDGNNDVRVLINPCISRDMRQKFSLGSACRDTEGNPERRTMR